MHLNRRFVLAGGTASMMMTRTRPARSAPRFMVPAEEHPHLRCFMQWPVTRAVYADREFRRMTQATIADIANTIAEFEPVVMLADAARHTTIRRQVSAAVELWDIPTDDLWCRDAGPLFVNDGQGQQAIRQMNFNGWGGKQRHDNDGKIAERVARHLSLPLLDSGLVGEPGGVDQDGHGLLIAHESSWINPNRNTGDRDTITALLNTAFGTDQVIWAPGIVDQDITDYHIDSLARFAGPGQVLIQLPDQHDPHDPWLDAPFETFDILSAYRGADGHALRLTVLPTPRHPREADPEFVASYANYYVCNSAVIMAEFGDPDTDAEARDILAAAYPDREVIAINVDVLGILGGGIHCATQQQPVP